MASQLAGPVGVRNNVQNVRNHADDQRKVMDLLIRVPSLDGGKKGIWGAPPLTGATGTCPTFLRDAIWDFQRHWKSRGRFHNIDGVVDPGGNTLRLLNELSAGGAPAPDEPKRPHAKPAKTNPRIPGSWQVTNMWSQGLGEVGLIGSAAVEIAPPDERKFLMAGVGGGFGWSFDPITMIKGLKSLSAFNSFASKEALRALDLLETFAKGIGFSIGDYLQAFGISFDKLGGSATGGRLIANPINRFVGRPTSVSRYLITEAGRANFAVASAGGGTGWGMESGLVAFGGPAIGASIMLCPVLGCYGSSGATMKFGGGAQIMMYQTLEVVDL